ncbi:molybdate transport system regulatory protein [Alkalispirillum mobile]|uniref:Molybdate transport system regulatory protein n=1 Tax=Alkalispirillum mobile TaxID=85925 RepID=A0A498BSU2_9GAMM|nr:TOBE domain-containing protein [Alkalispirillum mobile]RLK47054.1 molybdate transport system regulatory protein [Alkalispirillum mobile]
MQISARNNWPAVVEHVEKGPVSAEILLRLDTGDPAVAIITTGSANGLRLQQGARVRALVKASNVVILAGDGSGVGTSARNRLPGEVAAVDHGTVQSIVTLKTAVGTEIAASITKASAEGLKLTAGSPAAALIKASDVLLMVE